MQWNGPNLHAAASSSLITWSLTLLAMGWGKTNPSSEIFCLFAIFLFWKTLLLIIVLAWPDRVACKEINIGWTQSNLVYIYILYSSALFLLKNFQETEIMDFLCVVWLFVQRALEVLLIILSGTQLFCTGAIHAGASEVVALESRRWWTGTEWEIRTSIFVEIVLNIFFFLKKKKILFFNWFVLAECCLINIYIYIYISVVGMIFLSV